MCHKHVREKNFSITATVHVTSAISGIAATKKRQLYDVIFTARPHCLEGFCLSVRPSVCLSVRHVPVLCPEE